MCIAIFKPENVVLPESTLRNCWRNNPDGAGFMYIKNKKLIVEKGLMTYAAFRKTYKNHEKKRVVLHFRATSHGHTNETNTHPHRVNDKLAFVHNGVIRNITVSHSQEESDTYLFNEEMLKKLPENFIKYPGMRLLIEDYVGFSKLIFMTNTGYVYIFNGQSGESDKDGVWYSNDSYLDKITKERNGGKWEYDEALGDMVFKKKETIIQRAVSTVREHVQTPLFPNTINSTSTKPKQEQRLVYNKEEDLWTLPSKVKPIKVEVCLKCSSPMFREIEQKLGYCSVCLEGINCPTCDKGMSLEALGCLLCDECSSTIEERKLTELLKEHFQTRGSEDMKLLDIKSNVESLASEQQTEIANKIVHAHGLEIINRKELTERANKFGQIIIDKYEGS